LPLEPFAGDEGCEIGDAAGVAPLVVVPGEDLDHRATYDHRRETIDDRRMRIAPQIGRDQGLLAVIQNTLKRAGRCCLKGVVYFVFGGLSPYSGHEVDDGDGDGGNTQGHAIEAALQFGDDEREPRRKSLLRLSATNCDPIVTKQRLTVMCT